MYACVRMILSHLFPSGRLFRRVPYKNAGPDSLGTPSEAKDESRVRLLLTTSARCSNHGATVHPFEWIPGA